MKKTSLQACFTRKPTRFFVIDLSDPDVYFTFDGFTAKFVQSRINYWDVTNQPDLLLNLLATNATNTYTDLAHNEEDADAMNYYYNDDTDDYSDNEESSESDTEAMSGSDENSGTEVEDMNNSDENSDMLDY